MSASLKLTDIEYLLSWLRVANVDDEDELVVEPVPVVVPPAAAPVEPDVDELEELEPIDEEPDPVTASPIAPVSDVMVPAIGARSEVSSSAICALVSSSFALR